MSLPLLALVDDPPVHAPLATRYTQPLFACPDPCGVALDHHAGALYVADGYSGAIVRVDGARQRRIATVDPGEVVGSDRIGGLVLTSYGALFATRVGHGRTGGVVQIRPDGAVEALEKPSPAFWRMGLVYDRHEHVLYTTQFRCSKRGAFDGSIVAIDLVSGESSTVLDGFGKPVGIAKLGPTLVVTDARQRAVYRVDLVAGRAVMRLQLSGDLDRPDSVCACGLDSVLVTTYDDESRMGSVRRLWLDGRAQLLATGPWEPRGVATDGELVFVAARRSGRVIVFEL